MLAEDFYAFACATSRLPRSPYPERRLVNMLRATAPDELAEAVGHVSNRYQLERLKRWRVGASAEEDEADELVKLLLSAPAQAAPDPRLVRLLGICARMGIVGTQAEAMVTVASIAQDPSALLKYARRPPTPAVVDSFLAEAVACQMRLRGSFV